MICCTLITPMSAAGATILFPLVALGCSCLVIGVLSPAPLISRRPIPGVRAWAILAYSLYLTHKQVYALLDRWIPSLAAGNPLIGLVAYGAVCLLVAAVLYFAVERPGMQLRGLRRRVLDSGPASPALG